MRRWCKVVEVDEQQVLFWLDWSDVEDDQLALHQQATNGVLQIDRKIIIKIKENATDEETAVFEEKLLDTCDEKMARAVIATLEDFT